MKKLKEYIDELLDFNGKLIEDNANDNAELAKKIATGDFFKDKAGYYRDVAEIELRVELSERILKAISEFMEAHK